VRWPDSTVRMIGIAFLFVLSWLHQNTLAKAQSDYFPLQKGCSWLYKARQNMHYYPVKLSVESVQTKGASSIYTVKRVDGFSDSIITYERNGDSVFLLATKNLKMPRLSTDFDPKQLVMKQPVTKNGKWSWQGKANLGVTTQEDDTVMDQEIVTVPAGKFKCVKIATTSTKGMLVETQLRWYADHVGLVKEQRFSQEYGNEMVLTKFVCPKNEP